MKTALSSILALTFALFAPVAFHQEPVESPKPDKVQEPVESPKPDVSAELEKLAREAQRLSVELQNARTIAKAKAKVEKLKAEIEAVNRGEVVPEKPKPAPVLPSWIPSDLKLGEIRILKDPSEKWWFVERRYGYDNKGHLSLHAFGRGSKAKIEIDKYAAKVANER